MITNLGNSFLQKFHIHIVIPLALLTPDLGKRKKRIHLSLFCSVLPSFLWNPSHSPSFCWMDESLSSNDLLLDLLKSKKMMMRRPTTISATWSSFSFQLPPAMFSFASTRFCFHDLFLSMNDMFFQPISCLLIMEMMV